MRILDGRLLADRITKKLRIHSPPGERLAILVPANNDASSDGFVAEIRELARFLGVGIQILYKPPLATTEELADDLRRFGSDPAIGGIVLIMPLPPGIDRRKVLSAIPAEKDIDCLNPGNRFFNTPAGLTLVHIWNEVMPRPFWSFGEPHKVAVVGRGLLVGKPVIDILNQWRQEVSVFSSKTSLDGLKEADVVILGTGVPKLVSPAMLKSGAVVIDFGYPGDFDHTHSEADKIAWYAPAKGGTGPLLVACLMETFYQLTGSLK